MYDVIVIGAGPSGMACSLYLSRAMKKVLLLDKGSPGGQMLMASSVENYMGFSSISGGDLALKMFSQVKESGVIFVRDEVVSVSGKLGSFVVKGNDGAYKSRYVVTSSGREPNRFDYFDDVSYCAVCDGNFYKDKVVGVVGGGDSAFMSSLYLADICRKVYVFVRSKVKASAYLVNKVKSLDNIEVVMGDTVFSKDKGGNKRATNIDGRVMELDGVFAMIGWHPETEFIDVVKDEGYVRVDEGMRCNIPGMYACGDVVFKEHSQIALAVSDGVKCALSIIGDDSNE